MVHCRSNVGSCTAPFLKICVEKLWRMQGFVCKRLRGKTVITLKIISLGPIFQPVGINSVPDDKYFFKNKDILCYNQWYEVSCAILYISALSVTIHYTFKNKAYLCVQIAGVSSIVVQFKAKTVHHSRSKRPRAFCLYMLII